jgi:hypothetical protein
MSASHAAPPRSRRARSAEDESPVIVTSIAILGVVMLSFTVLIAPVVWSALVDSPAPRWSEQSCSQGTGAADAARCPGNARFQAFRPPPRVQLAPLIPHL